MHLPLLNCVLAIVLAASLCERVVAADFGKVMQIAGEMAGRPYRAAGSIAPEELRKLAYAQHRAIRMKPERALWHGAAIPFEISFVHVGMSYDRPVTVNEVSSEGSRRIAFDAGAFDYGNLKLGALDEPGVGYAGFRVLHAPDGRQHKQEYAAFLGASYFRAAAEGMRLGLAARGLAIDTGEASGEEFPRFVEFWIHRPAAGDRHLVIMALLDSRRATGAYRFVLRPGAPTRIEVKARIFLRENVAKLGIAALTSMYLYGENQPPAPGAARPEVHDSDGLSLRTAAGESLWRPLVNPRRLLITSFGLSDPAGFGLLQRDRSFRSYEDLDQRFDLKPGAWVVPRGRWGQGRVELVQIPSPDETNENIVAYWVPAAQPHPRKPIDVEYELVWGDEARAPGATMRVVQTRRLPGVPVDRRDKPADRIVAFAIDFESAPGEQREDLRPALAVSSSDNGEVVERTLRRHEATGGWRATLRVRHLDDKRPLELRAHLNAGDAVLSEVWSYVVPPE